MTLKCKKCSMHEECICDTSADECEIRKQSYNKAIEDYHRLIAEEIKNDPTNPYLLHLYNVNNYIKECLTKR